MESSKNNNTDNMQDGVNNNRELFLYQYENVIESTLALGKSFRLDVIGKSMMPTLREGDSVILERPDNIKKADIILYKINDTSFVMHRVVSVGDVLGVYGDNTLVNEHISPNIVIARVSTILRGEKAIRRGSLRYRWDYAVVSVRRFFRRVKRKLTR